MQMRTVSLLAQREGDHRNLYRFGPFNLVLAHNHHTLLKNYLLAALDPGRRYMSER